MKKHIFNRSFICIAVLNALAMNNVTNAADYTGTVHLSDTILNAGDSVITSDKDGIYGNASDQPLNISGGGINISVNNNTEGASGINLSGSTNNNIGTNSTITVVNGGGSHSKASIGINLSASDIEADHLTIDVTSENQAIGVNATNGSSADLGVGSTIKVTSDNVASAVYMLGGDQSFTADNIEMNSTSNVAFGIAVGGGNSTIDLGSNSLINATSNGASGLAAGLNFSGGSSVDFDASSLDIIAKGDRAYGVIFENTASTTVVDLGASSIIMVDGTSSGAGIFLDANGQGQLDAEDITIIAKGETDAIRALNGEVNIKGVSHLSVENEDHYAVLADGKGNVNLDLENGSTIKGNLSASGESVINIDAAGTSIVGQSTVSGNGQLNVNLTDGSDWNALSDSTVTNLTLDNSHLYIAKDPSDPFKGNVFTVKGDYVGNGGTIHFDTVLGGDDSETDKLVVEGDTSGSTNVSVNNIGGTGSQTINGIELITVGGQSDGEFVQDGRIVAGAYEYYLERGEGGNSNNWYLTNKESIVRPEGGIYSRNLAAANNMFVSRLHDRLGETHYIDALTGEQKVSSLWARQEFGKNKVKDQTGQLTTDSDRYILQLGGDIAEWSTNNKNRMHLGLMAGYANQSAETRNALSGHKANGSTEGVSVGLYGTWLQDNAEKTGLYLDSWAQYSWFNNKVNGEGLASEKYKSKGFTASLESGYTALIKSSENANYYIQPIAQVVWMGVNADDYVEDNGTVIKTVGDDNIQTRVGIRTYLNKSVESNGNKSTYQPFIEANWIHNSKEYGVQMDDIVLKQDGARNIGEVKLGLEGQANKNTTVWGNVAYQKGSNDYSDAVVKLGVKLAF